MNRAALLLTVSLAALLLHGCSWIKSWGDPEPGDPAPLVEFEPSLEVRKVWSTSIGDGMGKQGISMAPVFTSGMLYAADYEGRLVAVDAETGRKVWDLKTDQAFSGGPGFDNDRLYMGTIDGRVIAYDRNGGSELWNSQVSSEVLTPPATGDGIVIVRCIDGRVFGLDGVSGRRLWIHDHNVPLLTLRGNPDLLIRGGVVFVGYDDGSVTSLRVEDGSVIWSQVIAAQDGRTELDRLAERRPGRWRELSESFGADTAAAIEKAMQAPALNLVGKDTLEQSKALLRRAALVLTPDAGPAHIASAVGTPVIGLHAATWSKRSGPYNSLHLCVDHFEQAARHFRGKRAEDLRWGTRIELPGVMDLVKPDEVMERIRQAGY